MLKTISLAKQIVQYFKLLQTVGVHRLTNNDATLTAIMIFPSGDKILCCRFFPAFKVGFAIGLSSSSLYKNGCFESPYSIVCRTRKLILEE